MFLSSLSTTCSELGLHEDSEEFSAALSSILSAASHTNTMMWIGKMEDCPFDLSGQGQLLKQGRVDRRSIGGTFQKGRKWSFLPKSSQCHLLLFQKTIVLCKSNESISESECPNLFYEKHIR